MTDTDDELEQLREQTDVGTRAQSATPGEKPTDLEDAMVALLADVEDGEVSKTLSVRDARLTALVRALEDTGGLGDVGVALREQLGREGDADGTDRSEMLRLAVRLGLQEAAPEVLEAPLNTGINPRRSNPLKALKEEIKELFETYSEKIETPYDALERLPQTLLSDYGVGLGNVKESYIYRAIKKRMNRHVRSAVERTIGRLKDFAGMNNVRARKESNAHTHILLSGVLLAAISVTAIRTGKPANRRSPTVI